MLAFIPVPSFLNHSCILQIKSISLKCYVVHILPGWEFSLEKMNYVEKKGKRERKRGKGKSELLFLDHNVLKCDLPFSLRFPSCPVFFFFFFFPLLFLFCEGSVETGGKIVCTQNSFV